MNEQALVVFTPSGKRGRFATGTTVLEAARALGADLDSVCGGRGICGRCQIEVSEGEFAKHGIVSSIAHLSPFSDTEQSYMERRGLSAGRRLGCSARIVNDLVVDVPAESQLHRQVVRKEADQRLVAIDPAVRLYLVEVEAPDLAGAQGDLQRLLVALGREWGIDGLAIDPHVLAVLQRTLKEGKWQVTVAVHDGEVITGIWPGFFDEAFGVAFDVGSTTLAGHLCDLHTGEVLASTGVMNPQIRFGEDLMSRVSYVMMNPGGDREMTAAVRRSLDELVGELADQADVSRSQILEVTAVGNPIMHHLLLGLDPTELGTAPFALATDEAVRRSASEVGLTVHPGARLYVLPCIGGHVGADAAAVILAEAPHLGDDVTLLADVGTNAEIVLGNRGRLLAASSPTGPAFEGAQISGGQRAAPGAIERVRIDRETLEPRFKVIGNDAWSNESEFGGVAVTGICGSGIIEVVAEMFLAGVISSDGVVNGDLASQRIVADGRTFSYVLWEGEPRVVITQNDVRQIQLAKAALYAGCRLLMDHLGVERVDRIRLAGAFGSHIDPIHAMVLGLVPDCDPSKVGAAGNAAGAGARIALLSVAARREIERVVKTVEKIETAVEPRFQEHFVEAMGIPHASREYPRLATVVDLPERRRATTGRRRERDGV